MSTKTKIGIIICDRYRTCAGGKCLRAMRNMVTGRQDESLLKTLRLLSYFSVGLLVVISFDAAATIYQLARAMGWGG